MSLILHRDHRKIWMRIIPIIFVLSLKAFGTLCSRTFDAHEGRRNNSIISGDTELTSYSAGHRRLSAYPAGVQYDYTPSMVEAAGCIPCFSSIQKLPFIAAHFQPCNGHYLFVSALKAGESTHRLGAFALRSDILRTTTRNSPHLANGVFWYNTPGYSFGFSGVNDIDQNLADVSDDNDVSRLSWLFENGLGGFRAGTYNNIYGGKPAGDQWSKQIYSCTDYPTPIPASQPSGQPSFQPSSQPSMQPSGQLSREPTKHPQNMPSASPSLFDATNKPFCIPSVAPTLRPTLSITPSIPKMKITVVGRSAHNVSLTIVLSANRDSIGAIFCLAMKAGTIPTSIDAVKSGGTMRHYLTSTKPITIVIPGLLALASYKAYCYVELSDGSGSAYDDVIATSQVFSTSCCHSLSFSNAPVSVYGDVSQYSSTSGNIDLSTYVFSYYLDAPPARGSVVVTPKIILVDGIATSYNVAVVPSSLEFFSSYSASRLQGNFYLNTTSAVSGNFSVSLVVTGHDRNNFTTTPTNVRILARDQPLPGPRLMTCVFHSSGGYFEVVFDRPTDQAYITTDSWYCNQLFIFVGSNATICSWTSLSTVKGTFPVVTASSLSPGDAFSIKGGYLRSACVGNKLCKSNLNSQFLPYSTVIAQRPALPIAPSVTVIVPTQIGTCNDLLIDLSASNGNGGRPWTSIAWSIKAENGNATALIVFMRNNFESSMNHIIVPRSILSQTAYSIGITLTNFLGDSASATSIVDVSGDPNLPIVSILGLMSRVIKASDILSLQGSASLSNCALSTSLNYTWTLTSSSSVVTNSKSTGTGTDPRKYIAAAYSLKAGSSYKATLTVISLNSKGQQLSSGLSVVNIYVAHGNVIAAVRGGYARESRTNKVLTLDASISSDEDTSTGSKGLLFSWSCSIISLTNFGSACNFSSMSVPLPSTSLLSLPANQMVLSTKYNFLVTVTSADGRSASQSVTVIPLPTGCPVVFCNNTRVKFNYDKVLSLPGTITGNTSTRAAWTVYYDGVPVSLDRALTKPTVDFNRKEIISAINFPLTMLPYTFVAGRTYTFRLSASPLDDSTLVGKAEIVLTVNAPPIGGKTTVTPLRGHALVTDFMMSTTGWSDDLSDYPLSYSFSYQLAVSNIIPALTLTVLSPLPYAVSLLPPGLHGGLGDAGDVTVLGFVYDILNAASNASFLVNVMESDYNATHFIESSLKKNIPLGDTNKVIQTINVLSSIISSKNCSNSPNCTALSRESCLEEANTCGSCLSNYKGVVGNSNTRCVKKSITIGAVGSVCKYDDGCLFHSCENNLCVAPRQICPTAVPNSVCSGYGTCKSRDASGNTVQNCTIVNTLCTTACLCQKGHGGVDCSLDTFALEERSNIRVTMCSALTHVISMSEKSPQLFDSVASSLLSAYNKDEFSTISQLLMCSSVLQFLGSLASSGFLKGTKPVTQQIFAEISSEFVGTFALSHSTNSTKFAGDVEAAVSGMTKGIMRGMSKGQNPISVVTSNIRVTMTNELVSTLSNATFSPPATATELSYGSMQQKILITGDGASSCSSDGSYAQVSTLQFGINPRYGSDAIKSPLLQFLSSTDMKSSKHIKAANSSDHMGERNVPSHYITLQYSTEQNLDFSAQAGLHNGMSNVTIPECVLYDSVSARYISCGDCNLSSYTNFNVTFACYDINNLCPTNSKKSRRLNSPDQINDFMNENGYEDLWDYSSEDSLSSLFDSKDGQDRLASSSNDFSTLSVDDDSAESSDDLFDSRRSATTTEFGSVLRAINTELISTLSLNPFAMDLSKATPVLALVGSLCGSIILGLLFFLRWDKMDRHKAVYLLDEKERRAKNQIALDLRRGGNGVTLTTSKKKEAENNNSFIDGFNTSMNTMTEGKNTRRSSMVSMKSNYSTADDTVLDENDPASSVLEAQILIAQFSNHVLPKYYTANEKLLTHTAKKQNFDRKLWKDAFTTVRRNHYLTAMFYGSSLRVSRTLRFLAMSRKILLFLFIDTVVFGVFFPSDASCHAFKTKTTCLEPESKVISNSPLCTWDSTRGCSITPPPKSMTFVLLTSFIITIFVIVIDWIVGYIQSEAAAKRPRLELWGFSANSWLGSVHHRKQGDRSLVVTAAFSNSNPNYSDRDRSLKINGLGSPDRVKAFKIRENESDFIAREIFKNSLTPRVECIRLMTQVEEFLIGETNESNPWDISQDASGQSAEHLAAMKAISSQLMVNYDGTLKPITFRQKLFYKDRQDLIEKKLAAARVQADKVCVSIVGMKVDDDNLKDMVLVRKFILEQVSIFYRFSLDKSFSNFNGAPPEGINPAPWLLAWIFIILAHLFFLYWIFAWCVKNSGGTLNQWGTDYGVTLVQDVFISEVGKVCIMYVFAMMSVRPQLQVIKRVINDRALSLVQDEIGCNEGVSVVQHFSPACRAARLSGLSKLPASAILRSITDADVERCKEHKNFTLGTFIFYVITIAAVVAMVSEALIDQLLSCILSSLWLMFLLTHERLLAISPLLLIGIYCVVAGSLLYYFLIFLPSVKRARKVSVNAKNHFLQRKSRTNNMREGKMHFHRILRRTIKLYHYFLETIGYCHAAVTCDYSKQRRNKVRQATLSWCDMNRPQLDHGHVASTSEAVLISQSPGNLYSARKMARRLTEYMIPPYILSMRQSGSTFTREEIAAVKKNLLSSRISRPTPVHPMEPEPNVTPAVQSSCYAGKLARMFQANAEITTDSQIALKRMLCRHIVGAEAYSDGEECSVFDLHGALNDYISMADLKEMLSWTWNLFYPSGQELSSELKSEVDDLFRVWWTSPKRVVMSIYNGVGSGTYFNWATFSEFSDWFLYICGQIEYSCAPLRQDELFGYVDCPHRLN